MESSTKNINLPLIYLAHSICWLATREQVEELGEDINDWTKAPFLERSQEMFYRSRTKEDGY